MAQSSHSIGPRCSPAFLHRLIQENKDATQFHVERNSSIGRNNGTSNSPPADHMNAYSVGFSQISSASTAAFSRGRQLMDGENNPQSNFAGQGLMPVAESNNSINLRKQDLVRKLRDHEEEIKLLRKQLTEHYIKEAQTRNEKYMLEKRIAHMRTVLDQQQQDLCEAASKALSYRQNIVEENVHITYQLQDAQRERTTFVSFLLPFLAEYSMQPPSLDAQSIVSSVKVLFKHLREKLIVTEAKLEESHYRLTPWHSEGKSPSFAPQSPQLSSGAALSSPAYSAAHVAADAQTCQGGVSGAVAKNVELDDLGRYSPLGRRNTAFHGVSEQVSVSQDALHTPPYYGAIINRHVKFKDPIGSSSRDEEDGEGHNCERGNPMNRGTSLYTNIIDEPSSSYSPYLQTVPEEPLSSFSEVADDDPLPAIEGLQISGVACPGLELAASGYQINGTTSCNFEWVRHLNDGSISYIEGATKHSYLVTADDVDTYLAIEIQPLDDKKRKGELVKMFANGYRKVSCDPVMQSHIEKNLSNGHASYTVSLSTGYPDMWEQARLAIKRGSYSINPRAPSVAVVNEKFLPATTVSITYGQASEFSIITPSGVVHILRAEGGIPDVISVRDAIVLTLRLFIVKAGEKKKGKKLGIRSIFGFNVKRFGRSK